MDNLLFLNNEYARRFPENQILHFYINIIYEINKKKLEEKLEETSNLTEILNNINNLINIEEVNLSDKAWIINDICNSAFAKK